MPSATAPDLVGPALCRIAGGHRAAFLRGAAVGDVLAAIGSAWTDGDPAPLLLPGA
ncbi:hypothetical protein [Streptomyces sp. NPDC003943]